MDLINREAAIEALGEEPLRWSNTITEGQEWNDWKYHVNAIKSVPAVPAVPLDKLCEFLEKCGADSYCGTCKQIMGGCFTDGNGCGSEHFWKELLTKWMEENK